MGDTRTETELDETTHARYALAGIAWIDKIPTPVQIQRDLGEGKVYGRKLRGRFVDFQGHLVGGRHVAIEVKDYTEKRKAGRAEWYLEGRFPLSNIAEHQMATMQRVARMGGIGALYVRRIRGRVAVDMWLEAQHFHKAAEGMRSLNFAYFTKVPRNGWAELITWDPLDRLTWAEHELTLECSEERALELEGIVTRCNELIKRGKHGSGTH